MSGNLDKFVEERKIANKASLGPDYLQKIRVFYSENHGRLGEYEKLEFLEYLVNESALMDFIAFCEEESPSLGLELVKSYLLSFCEKNKFRMHLAFTQRRIGDIFLMLPKFIEAKDEKDYYLYALELAIKYDCICALQNLLLENKDKEFPGCKLSEFEDLIESQPDRRIGESFRSYFLNGKINGDWQEALDGYDYVPDIYVDYFATQGKEICKENLKSYKKSKLLSAKTTLEELNAFVDSYNWDDGVEIPYFIMKHKNCDLALRKKIFELGGGDCIDEDTYKDTKKDPWKQFILELDDMIKKEEH